MFNKINKYYPKYLELIPLVCILLALIYTFSSYPQLPEQIPSHFNAAGLPDSWSDKNIVTIFLAPLIGLFSYLSLALLNYFLIILPDDPGKFINLPAKRKEALGHIGLEKIRSFMARCVWLLNTIVSVMMAYLTYGSINIALGQQTTLGYVIWLLLLLLLALCFIMVIRLVQLSTPPSRK